MRFSFEGYEKSKLMLDIEGLMAYSDRCRHINFGGLNERVRLVL